ncbi:hypothetical protein PO909_011150 [Leuciscus waleckii]
MKKKVKVKKASGRLLSSRRGIVVRGQWKAVDVDPSLFSDQGLDGLVCFEELTDYSLVEPERAVAVRETTPKDKKKKRKASEMEAEERPQSDAEDKPDEEKNKRQKNNEPDEESQDEPLEEQISQDECSDVTPETQLKTSSKKKKKKKQKKPALAEPPAVCGKKSRNWSSAALEDPEAPGTDVSAWKDLFVPAPVLKALSALGFSAPTPIQALALPPAIRDRLDVLGAAETGSGKTLCFGIPMIHMILEWKEASRHDQTDERRNPDDAETRVESLYLPSDSSPAREASDEPQDDEDKDCSAPDQAGPDDEDGGPDDSVSAVEAGADDCVSTDEPQKQPLLGLILTPTRELAVQVKHHIDAVARFTGIKTALVVGGMAMQKQQRMLMRRPEIIIATPGRLWELIKERHAHLQDLRQLRYHTHTHTQHTINTHTHTHTQHTINTQCAVCVCVCVCVLIVCCVCVCVC